MIRLICSWCVPCAPWEERDRERLTYRTERTCRVEWQGARWLRTCDRGSVRWEVARWMTEVWILVANGGIHLHQTLSLKYVISSSPTLRWAACLQPLSPVLKYSTVCLHLGWNLDFVPKHLVVKQKLPHSFMHLKDWCVNTTAQELWNVFFTILV